MSRVTLSSMHDARDAEDTRLLAAGELSLLVESYYGVIIDRCLVKARGREDAALEIAGAVAERLLTELKRGKTYSVPFRVVVHKVIDWKAAEHFRRPDVQLVELDPERDGGVTAADLEAFESEHDLELLFDGLAPREREVVELRWLDGLEIEQVAERLGMTRNAVDQALFRAHRKLREKVQP